MRKVRPYNPSVLTRLPALTLMIGVVVTMTLHVGGALYYFDSPLGYVDPALLDTVSGPVRIKRALYDKMIDEFAAGGQSDTPGLNDTPTDLSSQGQELLDNAQVQINETIEQLDMQLRTPEDEDLRIDEQPIELPAFELPNDVLEINDQLIADAGFKDISDTRFGAEEINTKNSEVFAQTMLSSVSGNGALGIGPGAGGIGDGDGYKRIGPAKAGNGRAKFRN